MQKLISVALACLFSFGLFVLMTLLIDNEVKAEVDGNDGPVVFVTIPKEELIKPKDPIVKTKVPEPPVLVKTPDPLTTREKPIKSPRPEVASLRPTIGTTGQPFFPVIGVDGTSDEGMHSFSAAPKIRIEPHYPPEAAMKGIQGSVTLQFDVNEQGRTTNIRIIEANPSGYFENASKKALRKWKYDTKKEKGEAVASFNHVVTLDFKLTQD